jgi:hypothetical protein
LSFRRQPSKKETCQSRQMRQRGGA